MSMKYEAEAARKSILENEKHSGIISRKIVHVCKAQLRYTSFFKYKRHEQFNKLIRRLEVPKNRRQTMNGFSHITATRNYYAGGHK